MSPAKNVVGALCSLLFLSPVVLAQQTQTLPIGFDGVEGAALEPWLFGSSSAQRWQWVYAASYFSASQPIEITRIELRPDASMASWSAATQVGLELDLGRAREAETASARWLNLDNIWDAGSPAPFHRGSFALPAGSSGGAPQPWVLSFAGAPYVLDPRDGRPFVLSWRSPAPLPSAWGSLDAATVASSAMMLGNATSATSSARTVFETTRVPIVHVHWRPAPTIHAAMRGATQAFPDPLAVNQSVALRDLSWTPDPGGITSWEWDFDSDGIIDSTVQHPTTSFRTCGWRDVTLRVRDGAGGSASVVRRSFLRVDPSPVRAQFSYTESRTNGGCPLYRQYQDLSTGPVTSWAWDFDADGIVDSTARHPQQTVLVSGSRRVRLEVRSACGSDQTEQSILDTCVPFDDCDASAAVTIPRGGVLSWTLNNASAATSSPPGICYAPARDLWIAFRVTVAGEVSMRFCPVSGAIGFYPLIQVYTGTCAALTPVACGIWSCVFGAPQFPVQSGQTYFARISESVGRAGIVQLDLRHHASSGGHITRPYPGCGGVALNVLGTPSLGSLLFVGLPNTWMPSLIWFGTSAHPVWACEIACLFTASPDVVFASSSVIAVVPNDPSLRNARIFVQGAHQGLAGGCPPWGTFPLLVTSDTLQIDLQ